MLDDGQFQTLLALGFLFHRLGLDDKARRLYQTLLSLRPNDRSVLTPAAAAALGEGKASEALALLDRLDESQRADLGHPEDGDLSQKFEPVLWLMRAQALSALDRGEEASAAVRKYLQGLNDKDAVR